MKEVGAWVWFKITCVDVRGALGVVGIMVVSVVESVVGSNLTREASNLSIVIGLPESSILFAGVLLW